MSNVSYIKSGPPTIVSGGGPPHDGDMERRLGQLEQSVIDVRERLSSIEATVRSIETHGASKADIATLESRLIRWFVGTAFVMSGLAFAIARFIG